MNELKLKKLSNLATVNHTVKVDNKLLYPHMIVTLCLHITIIGDNGLKLGSTCRCSGCINKDCGLCKMCLDKPKFGGPGKKKKRCLRRQCLIMNRNNTTTCKHNESPLNKPTSKETATTTTLVHEFVLYITTSDMATLTGHLTWLNDQVCIQLLPQ